MSTKQFDKHSDDWRLSKGGKADSNFQHDRAEEVARQLVAGKSLSEIADEHNMHAITIRRIARWYVFNGNDKELAKKLANTRVRMHSDAFRKQKHAERKQKFVERDKEVVRYIIDGHTQKEAAEHFGLAVPTIARCIVSVREVDKELAKEYEYACNTHHFGRFRNNDADAQ